MNRFLPLMAAAGIALTAHAALTGPAVTYSETFGAAYTAGITLPDGWTTYGIGKPVAANFQQYFGSDGEAPFYRVFDVEGNVAAWSCSTFQYAEQADEWLVTPQIKLPDTPQVVTIRAVAAGAFADNSYRLLVSDGDNQQETFRRTPLLNTKLTGWETKVTDNVSYASLSGYEGKDVYLAFVNKSKDAGMLGLASIEIAPYNIDIVNNSPSVLPAGSVTDITLNVSLRTAIEVGGIKAVMTLADGTAIEKTLTETANINGTRYALTFENLTVPAEGLAYSIAITPQYEGAPTTVYSAEVGCPTTSYPPVVLVEEMTGSWCTNCPRGAAFMNYYADQYTGRDGGIKVIGIAIHGGDEDEPMLIPNSTYLNDVFTVSGALGYPSAFFNRAVREDPTAENVVKELGATRSNSRLHIKRVDYTDGQPVKVAYEVENSYSKNNMNQRVAMVIIENDVNSDDPFFMQVNGLSGASQQSVENTYGAALWPYFKFFCESPSIIPAEDMVYQHVARGIYPDYYGELISEPCVAEVPVALNIEMDMPAEVMKPENTAVVLMLLDGDNGRVLTAAEVDASEYNRDLAGIATTVADNGMQLMANGNSLEVTMLTDGVLDIYSIDGSHLRSIALTAGNSSVALDDMTGIIIARLRDAAGSVKTLKVIR